MATRKSARIASRISNSATNTVSLEDGVPQHRVSRFESATMKRAHEGLTWDSHTGDQTTSDARPPKRRKTRPAPNPRPKRNLQPTIIHSKQLPTPSTIPCTLPSRTRTHPKFYHHPLLLTSAPYQQSLLTWFTTSAIHKRPMPWRKPFTPPSTLSPSALSRRAYEVWISETMLQQTRVATVVGYYTRWMARWPTIFDLAAASEEEVLGMWAGLGYYSRARRVWEAAKLVVEMDKDWGVLPGDVEGLMKLPGVGRYTAGAVTAIVFGVPAPVVDGNVLRVLSRQMGVLGDVKGDRAVVEMLWAAAGELVKAVAGDEGVSERPGLWGQALMELGSTVCMPKPNCAACPVTGTCRVYEEGLALANGGGAGGVEDIEDLCTLCAPLEEAAAGEHEMDEPETKPTRKAGNLSRFFAATEVAKPTDTAPGADTRTIINHARKFPLKKPKKKVREEETLVCAIRRSDGRYLIHQRPAKGLLGGLWELPSQTLPESNDSTAKSRESKAVAYVTGHVAAPDAKGAVKHVGELGSVPWLFSHLKLTMHVHLFEVDDPEDLLEGPQQRWATVADIDAESMGTGMKKCWALVKEQAG